MKKTLLKKYLLINAIILILSFTFLCVMLWTAISHYWKNEKHELLTQNAKIIAELVQENAFEKDGDIYVTEGPIMQAFITTFASNIGAEIFVTNMKGETVFCSEESDCKHSTSLVPQSIIEKAKAQKSYAETTNLQNIYPNNYYIVGIPIEISSNESNINAIGIVFTASDTKNLYSFRMEILFLFFIAAIMAFLFSLLVVSIFSYKMTRPLHQMSLAAKSFGNGDFSQRVTVKSRDEVGQLADSLNDMADSLAVSENVRRSFVSNVSHELKTPMTTISGFIDGILDGTISEEKQNYYLKIVSSEIKRLSRLVKSMLSLSKIESETLKLNIQSFNISKIIFEILLSFEENIKEKQIEIIGLDNIDDIVVKGDIDMLYQVVYNLIENSVKFVEYKGYIQLSAESTRKETIFRIKNSGQGISSEELKMIFDRFYKTDKSRSEDKNGLGLGLHIVKTIINLHGGTITVSSQLNKYTEFEICLPNVID